MIQNGNKYKIRFGMEFEFMNYTNGRAVYDPQIYYLSRKWLHTREYYKGMQEIMSNPLLLTYKNFIKQIRRAVKIIKKISEDNECMIPLYSVPIYKYKGIISNGVHVHMSIYNKERKNILYTLFDDEIDTISKKCVHLLKENGMLGLRSVLSHHIFGYHRYSEYDFKRNGRFKPVIISRKKDRKPKTIEMRVFDLENILYPKKMYNIITNIAKSVIDIYEGKNIDIPDMYKDVERIFDYNNSFELICNDIENEYDEFNDYIKWGFLDNIIKLKEKWDNKAKYVFINGSLRKTNYMFTDLSIFDEIKGVL